MNASHLIRIAELATDVVAIDGGTLIDVAIAEFGDGSGRSFALITTLDAVNELEQRYRIVSPAPDFAGAPGWTLGLREWTLEVAVGDKWLELELELEDDGRIGSAPELAAIAGGVDPAPIAAAVGEPVDDFVNHDAIRSASVNELAGIVNEGGPAEFVNAAEAELERRRAGALEAVTIVVRYRPVVDGVADPDVARRLWQDAMAHEADALAERHGAEVDVHFEDMLEARS